ncbi:MAG: fused response regulator/thioredoxin-disulfide reductase, partial [Acidimicrobiales bacterium]
MFDYDARPVTPQVVLMGSRASSAGYSLRDFLSRNGIPYEWVDVDDAEKVQALVSLTEMDPGQLPLCVLPSGVR